MAVKVVPVQTPFGAQPQKYKTAKLKVFSLSALASFCRSQWCTWVLPHSWNFLANLLCSSIATETHFTNWSGLKSLLQLSRNTSWMNRLWHQFAPECAADRQRSPLAKVKTLLSLVEWTFNSQVPTCCSNDFKETAPLRASFLKLILWEQWELNCTPDTTEVVQIMCILWATLSSPWGLPLQRAGNITLKERCLREI